MLEATEDTLKAILALKRSNPPAWVRFMDWINQSFISRSSKSINEKDDVEYRWDQGRQQILAELVNVFTHTEQRLENKSRKIPEINPALLID